MLNFALVGCGRIAKRHAELLGDRQIDGARLVAVCDHVPEKAEKIGTRFSVSHFDDMHQMMSTCEIDVVVVLTESGNHAGHVIDLAAYGKHIVVEKPMALTLDDADEMIRACDKAGVRLFVVKQNRFNVPVVKLREALEQGRFGRLVLGTVRVRWCRPQSYYDQDPWRGTWKLDGGVLTNQASHHVDLLEWMFGEVDSVFGVSTTALVNIEAEDTAVVTLRFRNGALGVIEATTAARPKDLEGSISVLGESGTVEIAGFAVNRMKTWNFQDPRPGDELVMERYSVNPPNVYGFGHQAYYEHVVDCISNQKRHLVDGLEGRKSLELISAIYESIETGREVPLRFRTKHSHLGSKAQIPASKKETIVDSRLGRNVKVVQPVNLYGCVIEEDAFIGPFVEIQRNVRIGRGTKIQSHSFLCELVTIGEFCTIAHGVMFINDVFAKGGPARGDKTLWKSTTVGNRVSIGSNATILPVRICDDVVIGAGSVVTHDILEPGIYAGNPARLLRTLETHNDS